MQAQAQVGHDDGCAAAVQHKGFDTAQAVHKAAQFALSVAIFVVEMAASFADDKIERFAVGRDANGCAGKTFCRGCISALPPE